MNRIIHKIAWNKRKTRNWVPSSPVRCCSSRARDREHACDIYEVISNGELYRHCTATCAANLWVDKCHLLIKVNSTRLKSVTASTQIQNLLLFFNSYCFRWHQWVKIYIIDWDDCLRTIFCVSLVTSKINATFQEILHGDVESLLCLGTLLGYDQGDGLREQCQTSQMLSWPNSLTLFDVRWCGAISCLTSKSCSQGCIIMHKEIYKYNH